MSFTSPHRNSPTPQAFPVVIVGAGPAGLTLGNILRAASVPCVVLEAESREFIERRPRAGVLEEWAVRGLERRGLAGNLPARAQRHTECEFRFGGERYRLPYTELTGHHHFVYPQPLPGRWLSYSVGMVITETIHQHVLKIPAPAWTPAVGASPPPAGAASYASPATGPGPVRFRHAWACATSVPGGPAG